MRFLFSLLLTSHQLALEQNKCRLNEMPGTLLRPYYSKRTSAAYDTNNSRLRIFLATGCGGHQMLPHLEWVWGQVRAADGLLDALTEELGVVVQVEKTAAVAGQQVRPGGPVAQPQGQCPANAASHLGLRPIGAQG